MDKPPVTVEKQPEGGENVERTRALKFCILP